VGGGVGRGVLFLLRGNGETRLYVALCIGAGGVDGGDETRPLAVGPVGAGLAERVGCVER